MNVSLLRLKHKSYVTTAPPRELLRPVRAHGNAAEWIPIGVFLLLILEVSRAANSLTLHLFGGSFLLGRLLHSSGVLFKSRLSPVGATINYLVLLAMSVWAIWFHFAQ